MEIEGIEAGVLGFGSADSGGGRNGDTCVSARQERYQECGSIKEDFDGVVLNLPSTKRGGG